MRSLIPRHLHLLVGGLCLFTATGCGMFRSDIPAAMFASPAYQPSEFRQLPDIQDRPDARIADDGAPPASVASTSSPPQTNALPAAYPTTSTTPLPITEVVPPGVDMNAPSNEADTTLTAERASCYVEIRAVGKEPKRIRMSLKEATHVQKVLEQTGLVKEFRNMDINLSRKLDDGTRHKLEVHYDAKRKQVVSAFDYALHPDDLLVVRQDSSTSFDEMLKKLAGPLAR